MLKIRAINFIGENLSESHDDRGPRHNIVGCLDINAASAEVKKLRIEKNSRVEVGPFDTGFAIVALMFPFFRIYELF